MRSDVTIIEKTVAVAVRRSGIRSPGRPRRMRGKRGVRVMVDRCTESPRAQITDTRPRR